MATRGCTMNSFEDRSRARSYDLVTQAVAPRRTEPEPLRPEERAQQAVTLAARDVEAAELARVDVVHAHAANDRDAWQTTRDKLGSAVRAATKSIENARAVCKGAAPASVAQVAQLDGQLQLLRAESTTIAEPPRGYDDVALEAELLAAVRRHPEGDARGGFQRKEDEIRALMVRLSPDESRNLATRIKKQRPGDALAAAFATPSNLGTDRQERLLRVLGGAPRRESLRVGRDGPGPASGAPPALAGAAAQPVRAERQPVRATPVSPPALATQPAHPAPATQPAHPAPAAQPSQRAPTTSVGAQPTQTPIVSQVPSAAREDARVAATAAKPQLTQRGHAMQYYRLHQAGFLATIRARLIAANLRPGSPQLGWAQGPARFVEELGFALTGPESSELPELLHPSDPWALIDAHRGMDADPTSSSGAMGWAPAAGLALAGAVELSVRSSLPRMAARYAAVQGTQVASELVASHPMDRVVAVALCADNVVTRQPGSTKPATTTAGRHDVQTGGLRLVLSYHWLEDPALWNWIRVEEPANATAEEIALTLWNRTDFAYGLTLISGLVAIPKEWARQLPGVRSREHAGRMELNVFERSPAEVLAASKLGDAVAMAQGAHGAAAEAARPGHAAPTAPDRMQLVDTLDSCGVVLDELRAQLAPWALAYVLDGGRAFVARRRAALPDAAPVDLAAWGPVLTGQRAIVGEALSGMLQAVQLLTEAGVSAERVAADRSHPGLSVLYQYAAAAGTAQLGETARTTLTQAKAAHAMLPVQLIARSSTDAGRQLGQLQQGAGADRIARARAGELGADHLQLAGETAALQSQMMATGAADPVLLETAGIDAATLGLRAHVANLRSGLHALSGALAAADRGVLAAIANLSAGTRMILTAHHLDMAGFALGDVELTLAHNTPAAINARWDAMPMTFANREYGRQFELRETRKAQLARAQQQFTQAIKQHGLDGGLFARAEKELQDAQVRKLVANVAVMLAVGVASGGIAAMTGELASGMVGAGRAVTTIGEATGAMRTARIVGGVTNVAVDAGANAVAQTALNGDQLGSSFGENLLSNAAVRAALHPLHTVLRTWGGLDEQAYALWSRQGARWKLALAKTTVVTAELVTAAATGFVAHRLTTLAKGKTPDEQTMLSWAIQGATLALGHMINQRLGDTIARVSSAGRHAGELLGRLRLQQVRAKQVSERAVNDPAAAMQLLVDHQQSIHDEIELWQKLASDPAAAHALGMNPAQVAARLQGAEAQRADATGQGAGLLSMRFAGLTQEVEGSRLWVGDAEQITQAIAGARAAQLDVDVSAPRAGAVPGQRVWHVTLSGEPIQIRERARAGDRAKPPRTVEVGTSRTGAASADRDGHPASPDALGPAPAPQGDPPPATFVLAGDDAALRAAALRVRPKPGYVDVVVHASANTFEVVREHVTLEIDHRALATYLQKQGLTGKQVRLIACESGQNPHAVAQDLANKLKVDVLAPTRTAWIDGHGAVGVGEANKADGSWRPFTPQKQQLKGRPSREPYREHPELRPPDGSELDLPLHVAAPRVDARARVGAHDVAMLSAKLGAPVVIDPTLHNGVEVHAQQPKGLLGYDMTQIVVRVGSSAIKSDVMIHAQTVRTLRRYNGVLGKLRLLAERLFKGRGAGKDGKAPASQFQPGSHGYLTETELAKIKQLVAERNSHYRDGLIDRATLDDEVKFLEGQVAFHTETLNSMADSGHLHDDAVVAGAPDIGAVTRQAQAQGYKLPGETGDVGAQANPDHYYYRRAQHDATQFELARKPSAPVEAHSYKARVVNGEFKGLEDAGIPVPKEVVPADQSKEAVVARLRETEGFGSYAEMLEVQGIASRAVIDAAVTTFRGRKNQAGQQVTIDWLRHEVKAYFRDRVMAKLLDPALDGAASYQNMRKMLDGLNNADRGLLAEAWYGGRHAPGAAKQVTYRVARTGGENEGNVETRRADLVVGRELREVKHIRGKIDGGQFGAHVDLLRDGKLRETMGIDKVRYVFTNEEGAVANLKFLASQMGDPDLAGRLTVEVFDRHGVQHIAATRDRALQLLDMLKVDP